MHNTRPLVFSPWYIKIVFLLIVVMILVWGLAQSVNAQSSYIVDNEANVYGNDLTVVAGKPVMAYYDRMTETIKITICSNVACETGTSVIRTVVTGETEVLTVALTTVGGNPLIVYSNYTTLKVAACTDPTCSDSPLITQISEISTRGYVQDVIVINDKPLIVFTEQWVSAGSTRLAMKTAACVDAQCSNPAAITSLYEDWDSNWGYRFHATFTQSYPIISFVHGNKLKVAVCANLECTGTPYWRELDTGIQGREDLSMTLMNGNPVIIYKQSTSTRVAACIDPTCESAPTISSLASITGSSVIANVGGTLMIAQTVDIYPTQLKLSICADTACTTVSPATLLISGSTIYNLQMVDVGGYPAISYLLANLPTRLNYYYGGDYEPAQTPTPSLTPSNTPIPPTPTSSPTLITPTAPPNATPAPHFFAERHPTLTWDNITWALGYQIQIDDDPAFGSPSIGDMDANTLTYTTADELANGIYYWRVCAKKTTTDCGNWSATETIVISAS